MVIVGNLPQDILNWEKSRRDSLEITSDKPTISGNTFINCQAYHIPEDIQRVTTEEVKDDYIKERDRREFALADKPSNPKDIIGTTKVPMALVPAVTQAYLAIGHLEGDLKYGRVNWREAGVRTTIYLDALMRHLMKFKEGEWSDPVTLVPHLANALCCISIIIDAHHAGKLIDDRPKSVDASPIIDEMSDIVTNLQKLFGDKKPIDYFIGGPKQRE